MVMGILRNEDSRKKTPRVALTSTGLKLVRGLRRRPLGRRRAGSVRPRRAGQALSGNCRKVFTAGRPSASLSLQTRLSGLKSTPPCGFAVAEIVGQQRAPAGAEADAAAGGPFLLVEEIAGLAEVGGSVARVNFPGEMGV